MGADQRLAWEHVARQADRVRPLLHRAVVTRLRLEDPSDDAVAGLREQERVLIQAPRTIVRAVLTVGDGYVLQLCDDRPGVSGVCGTGCRSGAPSSCTSSSRPRRCCSPCRLSSSLGSNATTTS